MEITLEKASLASKIAAPTTWFAVLGTQHAEIGGNLQRYGIK
jgi:hypothetical protein